jgi:hypothetical protein
MKSTRAWRSELDDVTDRPSAALLREAEEGDQNLGGRKRIRKRSVARLPRRPEEVRELLEREALAAPVEEPSGEPHGVDDRRRYALPGELLDRAVEESDVEPSVVRNERCVAGESEKAKDGEFCAWRAAELPSRDPRQSRDRRREDDARVDERLERLVDRQCANADCPDLAHAIATRREPGRLEIEDDELGVLDRRLAASVAGKADPRSEPGQSRITVDDVGQQAARERRRRTLESEEDARRVLRSDRAPPCVHQLDQPVCGIERELHADRGYTNTCSLTRPRKRPHVAAFSQS